MNDEEQFRWRSMCLKFYWKYIVAQGDHVIDEVYRVNAVMGVEYLSIKYNNG